MTEAQKPKLLSRLFTGIPHEMKAIAEDALILALILVAATSAEWLVERLLGEHISPAIKWLLTASLWVMFAIYAISVLSTLRKLALARFTPGRDTDLLKSVRPRRRDAEPLTHRRTTDQPLTVLVVDDDALVARAIRLALECDSRIGTIMTTNSPEAAVARIQSGPQDEAPDVLLIDVNYRGIERTGIEALPDIRDASPRSKLLIMSVARDSDTVRAALANDADGFIWKNESAVDFAEAVVSASHHNFVASKSIARDVLALGEAG
jgi:CheY-like chemotaxis protein